LCPPFFLFKKRRFFQRYSPAILVRRQRVDQTKKNGNQDTMGLTGFYELLKKHAKDSVELTTLSAFRGRRIVVDASASVCAAMHHFGPDEVLLVASLAKLDKWMRRCGVLPVHVMDGSKRRPEKAQRLGERASRKRKCQEAVATLDEKIRCVKARLQHGGAEAPDPPPTAAKDEKRAGLVPPAIPSAPAGDAAQPPQPPTPAQGQAPATVARAEDKTTSATVVQAVDLGKELEELEQQKETKQRQTWSITPALRAAIVNGLRLAGCICIEASAEADPLMAELCRQKIADAVATDDADMFALGVDVVIRDLGKHMQGYAPLRAFDRAAVLRGLKLDQGGLVELALLLDCDYIDGLPGIGPVRALEGIRKHGTVDRFVARFTKKQKLKHPAPDGYTEQLVGARRLFTQYPVEEDIDAIRREVERASEQLLVETAMADKRARAQAQADLAEQESSDTAAAATAVPFGSATVVAVGAFDTAVEPDTFRLNSAP